MLAAFSALCLSATAPSAPLDLRLSRTSVPVYDYVELTLRLPEPPPGNPFVDHRLTGEFTPEGGPKVAVDGFCDSADGRVYRIRYMPSRPGKVAYTVQFDGAVATGTFRAIRSRLDGPVRVNPDHPWHFVREGTRKPWFYNGTTAYWLAGWDDADIDRILARLGRLKVTRIRTAISGRTEPGSWDEPYQGAPGFTFLLSPWVAARPDSIRDPGFDVTRFNIEYWQKWDRLLSRAAAANIVVSVIFYVDGLGPGPYPWLKGGGGGPDEQRYYRYAAARFAAYRNVMWDVTNEYQLFRDEAWAKQMGAFLRSVDPYDHATSIHGEAEFKFRTEPWVDFAMFQRWDEWGDHAFILQARKDQAATGRIMPQVNEEYGYEDHYPRWGGERKAPARSTEHHRRYAWGVSMAGGYQTTGERAMPGGGWINGNGTDDALLTGHGHMVDFFTKRTRWYRCDPDDARVSPGAFCLAEPGVEVIVYVPNGAPTEVRLEAGTWKVGRLNPRTGAWKNLPPASGPAWQTPAVPDDGDWVFHLRR